MGHNTYFEEDRPGWPIRLTVAIGSVAAAGLIALMLFVVGGVGREQPAGETTTPATTTESCYPFCLPADRPVPQ